MFAPYIPRRAQMEPKTIAKVDSRLARSSYGWGALIMGLPFVVVGGYFALAGFGYLPLPGKANAPLWVIGAVGLSFALASIST